MKIAAIQMVSGPDVARNLERARHWLEQARAQGAELAALPEYFCLMGQRDDDKNGTDKSRHEGHRRREEADTLRRATSGHKERGYDATPECTRRS